MSVQRYRVGSLPLPPYGVLTDGLQQAIDQSPEVPPDVCIGGDSSPHARLMWWREWKRETVRLISCTLWPQFDPDSQEWTGDAVDDMYDLTAVDLDIIADLRANVLRQVKPDSPLRSSDCPTHVKFFRSEDAGKWFAQYSFYDSTLDSSMIDGFEQILETRGGDKFGSAHLQFKLIFQRPRPSQTVFLLKKPTMQPLRAISAGSPSLCSGHSLQAVLGIGAVMENLILNGTPFSSNSWTALRQHTVDIGDRRVFAGLHYPADNLASWIIAMRLANHVFRTSDVKAHLWYAISKQSRVFTEVCQYEAYADALEVLRDAASDVKDGPSPGPPPTA
jgi:hypothetical protein